MDPIEIRSIVVATDLSEGSDPIVRTASSIAALTGADLHVVHVHVLQTEPYAEWAAAAPAADDAIHHAETALDEQVRRSVPAQLTPAALSVLHGELPSEAIRQYAVSVAADLLVIGPHAGPLSDNPYLGTTADRLVRTMGVPCLVVRGRLDFPVKRFGVLVDFSPASQSALETATAWAGAFSGVGTSDAAPADRPRISVAHIAWVPPDVDPAELEATRIRPELDRAIARATARTGGEPGIEYLPEVLRPGAAPEVVGRWVDSLGLNLLVMGTRGGSRLPYEYLGGLASTVARTADCSVLLVPPRTAAAGATEPTERTRLRRIVTGVDFHESSWEAALWAMRYFAPGAEHELVHIVDMPELPGPLRAIGGTREQLRLAARSGAHRRMAELRELGNCPTAGIHIANGRPAAEIIRLASEVGADLVVVGEQGPRHGLGALLGSTAERILFGSPVPVLLARKVSETPPRQLLVAVDTSDVADRVLDWTATLLDRFGGSATIMHVVDRLLLADELVGLPSADTLHGLEDDATAAMRGWLAERVDAAGFPAGRVRTLVGLGDPSYEIIAEARKENADLVVLGSRGDDVARTPIIGRIVNKVVRSAHCSVLVVSPGRAAID